MMTAQHRPGHPESDGAVTVADAFLSKSTVEAVAFDWLGALGWTVLRGPDIALDSPALERTEYGKVLVNERLRSALSQLNAHLPDDALRRLTRPARATLEARNRDFRRMVVAGVTVEYADSADPTSLFVNGLPLAVIELKNPADENATIQPAFRQLQTYKAEVPSLFACNAALIVATDSTPASGP